MNLENKEKYNKFDTNRLLKTLDDIVHSSAGESDTKRENANIDGDTAMGSMLKFGSETAKQYYETYLLKEAHSELHNKGYIHIHDLDFYSLTMTCLPGDTKITLEVNGEVHHTNMSHFDSYFAAEEVGYKTTQNLRIISEDGSFTDVKNCSRRKMRSGEKLYKMTAPCGTIRATGEHKIPVINKEGVQILKHVRDIVVGDSFIPTARHDIEPTIHEIDLIKLFGPSESIVIVNSDVVFDYIKEIGAWKHFCKKVGYIGTKALRMRGCAGGKLTLADLADIEEIVPVNHRNLILRGQRSRSNTAIHAICPLTEELGRFIGYIFSEGSVNKTGGIVFTNKSEIINDDFTLACESVFVKPNVGIRYMDGIQYGRYMSAHLTSELFTGPFGHKTLSNAIELPAWMFGAPDAFLKGFFAAMIDGDGCVDPYRISITTVCESLANNMTVLLRERGIEAVVRKFVSAGTTAKFASGDVIRNFDTYKVEITGNTKMDSLFALSRKVASVNYSEVKCKNNRKNVISTITEENYDSYVYDIETGTHLFSANGIVVHNCCQIDIDKLFKGGFSTGHGHLREPNDIRSYSSLACIALQSNQNDQHGGQSIPNFDYAMAKGVMKTFQKEYNKELKNAIELLHPSLGEVDTASMVDAVHDKLAHLGYIPRYKAVDCIQFINEEQNLLANFNQIEKAQEHAHAKARKATEKATYQAMEALVHNLNSMHSRAGAQVPFSSINYGTDTTPEGRLVIENLLWATNEGLGKGETPIFPIQIFRLKKGINFEKGDPNYDLFVLASYVSSRRLFPNFSFQDAPFNMQYYIEGGQETEIAYMGCAQKDELITYKIGDAVFVEGIGRAYSRLSALGVNSYGVSKYVDTEANGIKIFDSSSGGFVGMKKIIKNPNKNNWCEVKFSGGRRLVLTEDHPLPVEGKGRVFVKDLVIGDKVAANYTQYTNNQIAEEDATVAWLEGVILCDGCYAAQVNITVGVDETDIQEEVFKAFTLLGHTPVIKEHRRGERGNYNEIHLTGMYADYKKYLKDTFGGLQKKYRQIPNKVFSWSDSNRISFLAGMIDADAGMRINSDNCVRVQIGSTNKELALQQMALAQSLGYNAALYINHYNKKKPGAVRYRIEFAPDQRLIDRLVSKKKKPIGKWTPECVGASKLITITEINKIEIDEDSFDVETASDKFDLSSVSSHNCRSRVVANVYDTTKQQTYSRGNLSFTSINLPRLAIEANGDTNKFYQSLDEMIAVVADQLLERFEVQAKKKARNFPFLMGQGVWLDSEKLGPDDEIREVIKHGTLGVGFIGLAETLTALIGKHHAESEEAEKLGLKIVERMRKRCDELCEKHKLNFSLIATPAEGLSGRFVKIDKKIYGKISGITDKEYYTNSFHVPVKFDISIQRKIDIEAPYHALTNGGHITYVEVDKDTTSNIEAFMQVIRYMGEKGIGYGSINHPVDRDPVCGYNGLIKDCCPKCGRKEVEGQPKFERIRRITGYLVGTVDRFNNAKQAEERERIKHDKNK